MRRSHVVVPLVLMLALPALAEDEPDCSLWAVNGIRPGMSVEEATRGADFRKYNHPADPPGYLRYVWNSNKMPEKIDIHADMLASPPHVLGAGYLQFRSNPPRGGFFEHLTEAWGDPLEVVERDRTKLYTWRSEVCDAIMRASVTVREDVTMVYLGMGSISLRDEFDRRRREAAAAERTQEDAHDDDESDTEKPPGDRTLE